MKNKNIAKKARKDLNMAIISGKLTAPIQFTDANGNPRDKVYVELYTYVNKNPDKKAKENFKHYTVYVGGKNVDRLKKLGLVVGSALTVEGHVRAFNIPQDDGKSYKNYFLIAARDFYPTTFSGNTSAVILTGRMASRKAFNEENKKASVIKMYNAKGEVTNNIDDMTSMYFNVAVDDLGEKGEDGKYKGNTQFVPCVAYDEEAKRIHTYVSTGFSIMINGNIATTDIRDKEGKFLRRSTRVFVRGVRILEKSKDENNKYRKEKGLPIPQAKQAVKPAPAPAPAPVEEPDYAEACDF